MPMSWSPRHIHKLLQNRSSHNKGAATANGLLTSLDIIKGIAHDRSCAALADQLSIPLYAGDSSCQPVFLPAVAGAGAVLPAQPGTVLAGASTQESISEHELTPQGPAPVNSTAHVVGAGASDAPRAAGGKQGDPDGTEAEQGEAAASEYSQESFDDSYGDDADDFEAPVAAAATPAADGSQAEGKESKAGDDDTVTAAAAAAAPQLEPSTPAALPASAPLVQAMELEEPPPLAAGPGSMSLLQLLQGGFLAHTSAQAAARQRALSVAAAALGDLAAPHNPAAAAELERNAHTLAAGMGGDGSETILLDMQSAQLPAAAVHPAQQGSTTHGITLVKKAPEARALILAQASDEVTLLSLPGPLPEPRGPLKDLAASIPDMFNRHQRKEAGSTRFTVPSQERATAIPEVVDGHFALVVPGSIQSAVTPTDVVLLAQQVDPTLVPDADALLLLTRLARLVLLAVCSGSLDVAFTSVMRAVSLGGNTMLARRRALAVTSNGSTAPCIPVHEGSVRSLLDFWCGSTFFTPPMRSAVLRVAAGDAPTSRAMYARLAEQLEGHAAAVATQELMREHASNIAQEPPRQVQIEGGECGEGEAPPPAADMPVSPIRLRVALDWLVGVQTHLSRCLMSCMGLHEQHEVLHLTCVRACLLQGGGVAPTDKVHRLACRSVNAPLKTLLHAACKELSVDREDCVVLWQEGSCRVVLDVESPADLGMHWLRGYGTLWMLPLRHLELQTVPMLAHARYAAEVFKGVRWNTACIENSGADITHSVLRGLYPVETPHQLQGALFDQIEQPPGSPPRHSHSRSSMGSDMQAALQQTFLPLDIAATAAQQRGKEALQLLQRAGAQLSAKRELVQQQLQRRLPLSVQQAAAAQVKAGSIRITRPAELGKRDADPSGSTCSHNLDSQPSSGARFSTLSLEQGGGEVEVPTLGPSLADIACFVQSAPVQLALVAAGMAHISAAMDSEEAQMKAVRDFDDADGTALMIAQAALQAQAEALALAEGEERSEGGEERPSTPQHAPAAADKEAPAHDLDVSGGGDEYGDDSYEDDGYGGSGEFEESGTGQTDGHAANDASLHDNEGDLAAEAAPGGEAGGSGGDWPYLHEAPAVPRVLLADTGGRRVNSAAAGYGADGLEVSAVRHAQAQNTAVFNARSTCRQAAVDIILRRLGTLRQALGILTLQFDHFHVYDTRHVLGEAGLDVHAHQQLDPVLRRRAMKSAQCSRSRGGSPVRGRRSAAPRETSHSSTALGALMHASVVAADASGPWASLAGADSVGGPNARQLSLSEKQSAEDALFASPQEAIMSGVASVLKLRARRARERLAASRAVQGAAVTSTVITASKRQQMLAARPIKTAGDASVPASASQHLLMPSTEQGFISPYRKGQISNTRGSSRQRSKASRGRSRQDHPNSDITDTFISPVYSVPSGDLLQPQALTHVATDAQMKPRRPKGKRKAPKSIKSDNGDTIKVPRHLQRRLRSMSPRDRTHALHHHKMAETARNRQAANVRTALEVKAVEIQVKKALADEEAYKRSKRMGELLSSGHGEGALLYSPFRVGVDPALIRAMAAEKGYSKEVQEAVVAQAQLPLAPEAPDGDVAAQPELLQTAPQEDDSKEGEDTAESKDTTTESKQDGDSGDEAVDAEHSALLDRPVPSRPRVPRLPSRGTRLTTSKVGLLGMGASLSSTAEASMQARSDARYDVAGAIERQASRQDRVAPLVYSIILPPAPAPPSACTFGSGHFEATAGEVYVFGADPLLTSLEPVSRSQSARGKLRSTSPAAKDADNAPIAYSARESRASADAKEAAERNTEAVARRSAGLLPAADAAPPAWDSSPPGRQPAGTSAGAEGMSLNKLMATAEHAEALDMADDQGTTSGAAEARAKAPKTKKKKKSKKKKDVFSRLYRDASLREQELQRARGGAVPSSGMGAWSTAEDDELHAGTQPAVGSEPHLRRMYADYAGGAPDKYATVALTGGVRSMAQLRASSGPLSAAGAAALYNFNKHNSTVLMSSTVGAEQDQPFDESQLDKSALRPSAGVNGRVSNKDIGQTAGSRAVMVTAKERFSVASSVYQSRYPDPKYPNNPYQSTKGGKAGIHIDWQRNLAPARRDVDRRAALQLAANDQESSSGRGPKRTSPADAPPTSGGVFGARRAPHAAALTQTAAPSAQAEGKQTAVPSAPAEGKQDEQDAALSGPLVSKLTTSASGNSLADDSLAMSGPSALSAAGQNVRSAASLPVAGSSRADKAGAASTSLGGSASNVSLSALNVVIGTFTVQMDLTSTSASDPAEDLSRVVPDGAHMELFYDHFRLSPPCKLSSSGLHKRHTWHQLVHIGGNEADTLLKLPLELRLYAGAAGSEGSTVLPAGSFAIDLLHAMWEGSAVDGSRAEKSIVLDTSIGEMVADSQGATAFPDAAVTLSILWKPAL